MISSNIEDYQAKGYSEFKQFLTSSTVQTLNDEIDKIVQTPLSETMFDESGSGLVKQIQYLYNYGKVFEDVIDLLRPMACELTGYKQLNVINMQLFEKHPDISKPTRSHQDNAYFKVSPPAAITFWIALDDIDDENGALYYAPYTHLTPTRRHQRYHRDTTFRMRSGVPGLSLCLKEHPEETDLLMQVKAGDVLAHHCNLVHRAGQNKSENRRRRAIGVAFVPAQCDADNRLVGYATEQLREDIRLQEYKNPALHRRLMKTYDYLFE
jgi:phytanoyl-CoA hydroxylase